MATKTAGQAINDLPAGVFKTLHKIQPMGALQTRKQISGAVAFYWRYSIGTSSERVLIGLYDSAAAVARWRRNAQRNCSFWTGSAHPSGDAWTMTLDRTASHSNPETT